MDLSESSGSSVSCPKTDGRGGSKDFLRERQELMALHPYYLVNFLLPSQTHLISPLRQNMQSLSVLAILLLGASSDGSSMVAAFSPSSANKISRIRTRTGTSTSTSNAIDRPSSTTLYLEDHIADLIDRELVRVGKLKEWEAEFAGTWCGCVVTQKHTYLMHWLDNWSLLSCLLNKIFHLCQQ